MLVVIDIGNSKIKIGLYPNYPENTELDILYFDNKISKLKEIPEGIANYIKSSNNKNFINACIISSVVPNLNKDISCLINNKFNVKPIFVNLDLNTGVKFNYNPVSDIGADRIADSVAVNNLYPKNLHKIVIDFGTATVFEVISNNGNFLGGSIFPGLEIASKALAEKTSLLKDINFEDLDSNQKIIGNSTDESLKSSLFWGYISLTEGMVKKILDELKITKEEAFIVGTGGFASLISNHVSIFDKIEPNLTLEGLRIIYQLNYGKN